MLTADEQNWIANEIESEKRNLASKKKQRHTWRTIVQPSVIALTAAWFLSLSVGNALVLGLPKIIQRMSGYGPVAATLISAVPYVVAAPFTLLIGWNSDRTGERRWHAAGCMLLAAASFATLPFTENAVVSICALSAAAMGIRARQSPLWSAASSLLTGTSSAIAIAFISSFGQLGGFVGPAIVGILTDRTGTFAAGTFYFVSSMSVAAVLMLLLPRPTCSDQLQLNRAKTELRE